MELEALLQEKHAHARDLLKEFNTYKEKQVLALLQAEHDHDQKLSLLKQELEANQSKRALDEARASDHKVQKQQNEIQLQTKLISDLNDEIKVRLLFYLRTQIYFPSARFVTGKLRANLLLHSGSPETLLRPGLTSMFGPFLCVTHSQPAIGLSRCRRR